MTLVDPNRARADTMREPLETSAARVLNTADMPDAVA